eukprot:scaffold280453_cov31-Tisochrysis_lutea.AAC.3
MHFSTSTPSSRLCDRTRPADRGLRAPSLAILAIRSCHGPSPCLRTHALRKARPSPKMMRFRTPPASRSSSTPTGGLIRGPARTALSSGSAAPATPVGNACGDI